MALLVAVLAAACGQDDDHVPGEERVTSVVDTWVWPGRLNRQIDLLFVIDNSSSMAGEQAALAAAFPDFIGVLQTVEGGLPDMHIGVVSSDVGAAGQPGVAGCGRAGDDGELLVPAACTGLDGTFISDVDDGRGERVRNYTGELDDLFACMAQVGTDGCGFEMHLEAMRRALQPGKNPGFLRPGAYLMIVIVADEDDCSTDGGAMFGDPSAGLTSPLGPLTSFRCFEFGVECDGDTDPRAFGTRTGCRPRVASPYMVEVEDYVAFLRGLKPDPSLVMVSGVVGIDDERHAVVIGPDPANPARPAVQKSCVRVDPEDPDDGAAPPIRLASFIRSFPNRNAMASICGAVLHDVLSQLPTRSVPIFNPCLRRPLADVEPMRPGLQPECSIVHARAPYADEREETVVPTCAATLGDAPCWQLVADPEGCFEAPDHLSIEVRQSFVGGLFEAQCLVR